MLQLCSIIGLSYSQKATLSYVRLYTDGKTETENSNWNYGTQITMATIQPQFRNWLLVQQMASEVAQSICYELLSKQTHSETKLLRTFSDLGAGATTHFTEF